MAWVKEAITDGEIDALCRAALAACNEDTCYPLWRGSSRLGGGQCCCISQWLVGRLGGHVGAARGHYVWLSPDQTYYIDLTGHHASSWIYTRNRTSDTDPGRLYHAVPGVENARGTRFSKRADRIFAGLDGLLRTALDYAGDAYPAEEPQAADDSERFDDSWTDPDQYWHDEPNATTPEGSYQFVFANGELEVSPNHSHDELAAQVGIVPAQHQGPFAAGHVVVTNGKATWEAHSNVNLHALFRVFKDATKDYGWQWGGLTDAQGQPIAEQFGPKKSVAIYHYAYVADHLYLGRTSAADLVLRAGADGHGDDGNHRLATGTIRVTGTRAMVAPVYVSALPHLFEWAVDNGVVLYANNDNVIKTIPDLQDHNTYDPNPFTPDNPEERDDPPQDERLPSGLYRCPACERLFPNWHEYGKHRREEETWGDADQTEVGEFPKPDPGQFGDGAHFTEQRQEPGINTGHVRVLPARTWQEAARVDGFAKYAKAFKYDNDQYDFYVAYRNGDPLGYAAMLPNGGLHMIHASVENQGIGTAIYGYLMTHFRKLHTHAAHEKTAHMLQGFGWVQSNRQLWRWSADQAAADLLDAPIPFIFDVDKDKIYIGRPGARTSDIPGKFTPGGIVEGTYEPGGKVVIQSLTSVPYTIRHLVELWYYSQPQMEVKSVHLQDADGKDTKMARVGAQVLAYTAMDPAAQKASFALQQAGGEVYVVGGAVRNVLLGHAPEDIDLMVLGLPEARVKKVLKKLPGTVAHEGKQFTVFHYRYRGHPVQIALPRREQSTGPGHRDFKVSADHTMSVEEDFRRRDYTVNAIGVKLRTGQVLDPFHGARDIETRTLRSVTARSLAEDPLRVVRGLVAASRHGLAPDAPTRAQMTANAPSLINLPGDRIQQELDKIMESADPVAGIRLAHDTGSLQFILPEVEACFGYDQNNPHHEQELGEHLLSVLARVSRITQDPDVRLAALLHDIGKPGSAWVDPETGGTHYYEHQYDVTDDYGNTTRVKLGRNHEDLSVELARFRMQELRYPNDRIARVCALVGHHMWAGFTTQRGARRFMAKVGNHADDLFDLRWADGGGKADYAPDPALNLDTQRRLVERVRNASEPTSQGQLAINGRDLITAGISQGPIMGAILTHLTESVIDDPTLNTRDTLLTMARSFGG